MTDPICLPLSLAGRLPPELAPYAAAIERAAGAYGIDPFTFAAIVRCESNGGDWLEPKGPGGTGDEGHGHGLCQIDDRSHADMLRRTLPDGTPAWKDPECNCMMGAEIFSEYLHALADDYPSAICAYNAGPGAVHRAHASLPPDASTAARIAALDKFTAAPHRYVSEVLAHRDQFLKTDPTQGA